MLTDNLSRSYNAIILYSKQQVLVAEHDPDGVFVLPINLMITDARSEAVRVLITFDGWSFPNLN